MAVRTGPDDIQPARTNAGPQLWNPAKPVQQSRFTGNFLKACIAWP